MGVEFRIEPETGLAIATGTGVLRRDDAREGVAALWAHPAWAGRSSVWDFRRATFDITPEDIGEVAEFVLRKQPSTPPARVAFVTGREVDFGLARMFGAHRDDPRTEFRVFRDLDEALDWARGA